MSQTLKANLGPGNTQVPWVKFIKKKEKKM